MQHEVVDAHQTLTEHTRCWDFASVPYVRSGLCSHGARLNWGFKVVPLSDGKEFLYCAFKTVYVTKYFLIL